jgi:hypothetical protein
MDMTSEKPYNKVNAEQTKDLPHGKAYYSAGATVYNPTAQAFKDVAAIQNDMKIQIPQAHSFVGMELYPTAKILEVSNDAMAFSGRGPQSNVIINVSWSADDLEKVNVGDVREKVGEIIKAVQGVQAQPKPSYGNYGMPLSSSIWIVITYCAEMLADDQTVIRSWVTLKSEGCLETIIPNFRPSRRNTSERLFPFTEGE